MSHPAIVLTLVALKCLNHSSLYPQVRIIDSGVPLASFDMPAHGGFRLNDAVVMAGRFATIQKPPYVRCNAKWAWRR